MCRGWIFWDFPCSSRCARESVSGGSVRYTSVSFLSLEVLSYHFCEHGLEARATWSWECVPARVVRNFRVPWGALFWVNVRVHEPPWRCPGASPEAT